MNKQERARLAKDVHALRERAGMSQQELAAKAGTSLKTINNIENDRVAPQRAILERVYAALGEVLEHREFYVSDAYLEAAAMERALDEDAHKRVIEDLSDSELLDEIARRMAGRPRSTQPEPSTEELAKMAREDFQLVARDEDRERPRLGDDL